MTLIPQITFNMSSQIGRSSMNTASNKDTVKLPRPNPFHLFYSYLKVVQLLS